MVELQLGVIDDPVKGREEASSPVVRERTWNWFTDDFRSRFAKNSAMLIIMTRWHVDDLLGRYIAHSKAYACCAQSPIIVSGGIFPIEKLQVLPFWDRPGIIRSVKQVLRATEHTPRGC